jgi:muconolactone delta-isomerase
LTPLGIMNKYMVTITLPTQFSAEYLALIPSQRAMILKLLSNGRLSSFSLNKERSTVWMVAASKDMESLEAMLAKFPMHRFFQYEICELIMHDTQFNGLPKLVLN